MKQAGIKSICTEEREKKVMTAQICVQISVVSGGVPPLSAKQGSGILFRGIINLSLSNLIALSFSVCTHVTEDK